MTPGALPDNPFPGLRPFTPEESARFFGRDEQIGEALDRLMRHKLLAVVGMSGCGKSSLVTAGMVPALEMGLAGDPRQQWRIEIMRPGDGPLRELERCLGFGGGPLAERTYGLRDAVKASLPANQNLLLVVDQFEEIFPFRDRMREGGGSEADLFVSYLLSAAQEPAARIYIVLTMRSDYLGECAKFHELPEALNDGQYLVPRMTRAQLQEAIENPLEAIGGVDGEPAQFHQGLVQKLLNDCDEEPDNLPLLQHLLRRLFEQWQLHGAKGQITPAMALEVGELSDALNKDAEGVFQALSSTQRPMAEAIFRRITESRRQAGGGAADRPVRSPQTMAHLSALTEAPDAEVRAVVGGFEQRGLLVVRHTDESDKVDLPHECLCLKWRTLKGWIEQEAQDAKTLRFLADSVGKSHLTGSALTEAVAWQDAGRLDGAWSQRYLNRDQIREVDRSVTGARQRERRRLAVVAVVVAASLGVAVWMIVLQQKAETARRGALSARDEADTARGAAVTAKRTADLALIELQARNRELAETSDRLDRARVDAFAQKTRADAKAIEANGAAKAALDERKKVLEALEETEAARRKQQELAGELKKSLDDKELSRASEEIAKQTALDAEARANRGRELAEAEELAARASVLQRSQDLPVAAQLAVQAYMKVLGNRREPGASPNDACAKEAAARRPCANVLSSLQSVLNRLTAWRLPEEERLRRLTETGAGPARGRSNLLDDPPGTGGIVSRDAGGAALLAPRDSADTLHSARLGVSLSAIALPRGWKDEAGGASKDRPPAWNSVLWGRMDRLATAVSLPKRGRTAVIGLLSGAVVSPDGQKTFRPAGSSPIVALAADRLSDGPAGIVLATIAGELEVRTASGVLEGRSVAPARVRTITLADDGSTAYLGTEKGAYVWALDRLVDDKSPTLIRETSRYDIRAIAIGPRGRIALGTSLGAVLKGQLDGRALRSLTPFTEQHAASVTALAFSPDGTLLATAGADGGVRVYHVDDGLPAGSDTIRGFPAVFTGHSGFVESLAFPDNRIVFSGGADGTIRRWSTNREALVSSICDVAERAKLFPPADPAAVESALAAWDDVTLACTEARRLTGGPRGASVP